ncbi:MAG: heparan-alpha-glucosaminide N-acetyltransferase [Candidatus Diapherotrites archaeon]
MPVGIFLGRIVFFDFLRGLAVLGMILFHFFFDLNYFNVLEISIHTGAWFWFARIIAGMFVFLAGITIPLAFNRKGKNVTTYLLRRGLFLIGLGGIITLVTYFLFPAYTIWFGILHFLGAGMILSIPFAQHPRVAIGIGTIVLLIGIGLSLTPSLFSFPHWIGIFPFIFTTFDYFPLLPWFGLMLLGMGFGHYWYKRYGRVGECFFLTRQSASIIAWLGRKSLLIYLIHQPILVGFVLFFRMID